MVSVAVWINICRDREDTVRNNTAELVEPCLHLLNSLNAALKPAVEFPQAKAHTVLPVSAVFLYYKDLSVFPCVLSHLTIAILTLL